MRFLSLSSIACSVLLLTACTAKMAMDQKMNVNDMTSSVTAKGKAPAGQASLHASTCTAHGGMETGILSAEYDAKGKLTGWSCVLGSQHSACKAGPNGIWKECTFPPSMMPWPDPVSKDLLTSPPPPTGVISGMRK